MRARSRPLLRTAASAGGDWLRAAAAVPGLPLLAEAFVLVTVVPFRVGAAVALPLRRCSPVFTAVAWLRCGPCPAATESAGGGDLLRVNDRERMPGADT